MSVGRLTHTGSQAHRTGTQMLQEMRVYYEYCTTVVVRIKKDSRTLSYDTFARSKAGKEGRGNSANRMLKAPHDPSSFPVDGSARMFGQPIMTEPLRATHPSGWLSNAARSTYGSGCVALILRNAYHHIISYHTNI